MTKPTIKKTDLHTYHRDARNANKGTSEGKALLQQALEEVGAGRSVVVDAADTLIAGNQTLDAALAAGMTEAWEVELPPHVLLVAKRADLALDSADDPRARRLAHYDNLTADKSHEYDPVRMLEDYNAGILEDILRMDEVARLQQELEAQMTVAASLGGSTDTKTDLKSKMIKPVLYSTQVGVFERAMRTAAHRLNTANRAEALLHICQRFLEVADDEEKR